MTSLGLLRRVLVARAHDAADLAHEGDALQVLRAVPAVDRHVERTADARVVERLLGRIEEDVELAHPARFLNRDLVAERLLQLIALLRREAAELGRDLPALQRVHHRRAREQHGAEPVEIGLARLVILLVALADPVRALDVLDEPERPAAEDVRAREVRVLLQLRRRIEAVPGAGEVLQHRRVGLAELEDHRVLVGGLDRRDVLEGGLAERDDPLGRLAQAVVGRLDVLRREGRTVVELDVLLQLERVGQLILRHLEARRRVRDHLRIVGGVELQERRVVRREPVDRGEARVGVAVVVGRLAEMANFERAALLRRLRQGRRGERDHGYRAEKHQGSHEHFSSLGFLNIQIFMHAAL